MSEACRLCSTIEQLARVKTHSIYNAIRGLFTRNNCYYVRTIPIGIKTKHSLLEKATAKICFIVDDIRSLYPMSVKICLFLEKVESVFI